MKRVSAVIFMVYLVFLSGCVHNRLSLNTNPTDELSMKTEVQTAPDYRPVSTRFFIQCESDIIRSSDLIAKRELVLSLSHLNRMNAGGRRYYLLEKENITEMLNKLSSYQYRECYIINSKGIIIYTMKNDELLGKPVRAATMQVQTAFKKGINGEQSVEDVNTESLAPASYDLHFGCPVFDREQIAGVIVSAVSIEHLVKQFPKEVCIVSSDGDYRYKNFSDNDFISKDIFVQKKIEIDKVSPSVLSSGGITYMPFSYKTIHWCIITSL